MIESSLRFASVLLYLRSVCPMCLRSGGRYRLEAFLHVVQVLKHSLSGCLGITSWYCLHYGLVVLCRLLMDSGYVIGYAAIGAAEPTNAGPKKRLSIGLSANWAIRSWSPMSIWTNLSVLSKLSMVSTRVDSMAEMSSS
jgi:hypothetical protein